MTKAPLTLATIILAAAIPVAAIPFVGPASGGPTASARHDRVLMRRKTARRASRGTGIVTGGKPTATGGTPGGMPDRQ